MYKLRSAAVMALGLAAALMASGCQRTVSGLDTRGAAEPLTAAPVDTVQTTQLDPAQPTQIVPDQQIASADPALQQPQVPASVGADGLPLEVGATPPPAASSTPVSRESLAGTWTVASDNPECRIILAFTKWSGGYRAATRRCDTAEIGAITAWDVKDNKVVLVDANGNQVASLASTGAERYDGSTAGGKPVSFSR